MPQQLLIVILRRPFLKKWEFKPNPRYFSCYKLVLILISITIKHSGKILNPFKIDLVLKLQYNVLFNEYFATIQFEHGVNLPLVYNQLGERYKIYA